MRPITTIRSLSLALATAALSACSSDAADPYADAPPVIANYAAMAEAMYADTVTGAMGLKTAVDAFTASPTADTFAAAKAAWIASRVSYPQTEGLRFAGGPIDGTDEGLPEIRINSWPLDENYIDYVQGMPTAGLIDDASANLSMDALKAANMNGKEEYVSTGYHAIEFLLWGQDFDANGPGARPFTDYVDGGTAANQGRRRQYLGMVTEILVEDLTAVRDSWAPGNATNYAHDFGALAPKEALRRILTGMGVLASAELSGERMLTAYENKDQEDEHSCFSDTTTSDLLGNAKSLENVYLGRYGSVDGPGLDVLVLARDPALDAKMKQRLTAAIAAVGAIPAPFDQAILGDDSAPGRQKVDAAIKAVRAVGETVGEISTLLGIEIVVE